MDAVGLLKVVSDGPQSSVEAVDRSLIKSLILSAETDIEQLASTLLGIAEAWVERCAALLF